MTSEQEASNNLDQFGSQIWGAGQATLPAIIGSMIRSVLGLLGVLLVVIIMYAGYTWMTANGNDEKVLKAKKMIFNAVVGMVLIFSSYAIASFVISAISTATTG